MANRLIVRITLSYCYIISYHHFLSPSIFRTVIGHTRTLDPTRPVTFVSASDYELDKAVRGNISINLIGQENMTCFWGIYSCLHSYVGALEEATLKLA